MSWIVEIADEFVAEFLALERPVRIELAANAELLKQFGPQLGRPRVDTLNGSRYANMKELRFMGVQSCSARAASPGRVRVAFIAR